MRKNIAILDIDLQILLSNYFKDKDVEIVLYSDILEIKEADIVALKDFSGIIPEALYAYKILNVHPSLLPAFAQNDAIKEAFVSGVKVSGVSVHYVEKDNFYGKILAQYPVLIGNTTHFNEYCEEVKIISDKIYPPVIDSVLNDRVFDFVDLFKSPCQKNGCSGCGGCH